jgi:hypothetical protein
LEITVTQRAQIQLERLLAGLERELIYAEDVELMEVVAELGLKPSMKGSVALLGVTRHIAPWAVQGPSSAARDPQPKRAAERRRPKGSSRGEL